MACLFYFVGVQSALNIADGMSRSLFKAEIKKRTWVRDRQPQIPDLLIYQYTDWANASDPYVLRQRFIDIFTDGTFKAPAIQSADAFVKKQAPTYLYQLETAPRFFLNFSIPAWIGIYHGADLAYTFGAPLLMHENYTTHGEIKLSKGIMTMWSNFAKTG